MNTKVKRKAQKPITKEGELKERAKCNSRHDKPKTKLKLKTY